VKVVTLRKLPPEVGRAIQRRARERGTSISKAVISLLEEAAGIRRKGQGATLYHDLDALAGSWTKEEAATFEAYLRKQRRVDRELWQ
jgi:hypothetical protein